LSNEIIEKGGKSRRSGSAEEAKSSIAMLDRKKNRDKNPFPTGVIVGIWWGAEGSEKKKQGRRRNGVKKPHGKTLKHWDQSF